MSEKFDQDTDYKELTGNEGLHKIAELIKGIHIAMLTTVAEDGSLSSRPMAVKDTTFDGTFWFLTRSTSEKVGELAGDTHVTLTFSDDAKYIALKGFAHIHHDRSRIHELWSPMDKAWFPQGEDDPGIAVLRVDIVSADYWESRGGKILRMLKYAAAAATGGKIEVGEAGHVTI